ncbi:hypothetical protein D3C74_315190 [compost metagenome]
MLNAPAPAPAVRWSSPEVARFASGENTAPVPIPNRVMGATMDRVLASGATATLSHTTEAASSAKPVATTHLAGIRSDNLPANGATTPDTSDPGRLMSAASIGESPRIDCRKIVSGKKIPIIPNDTAMPDTFASEKLREWNSVSGSRARSPRCRCHSTNAASTRTPRPMIDQMVSGPTTVPQW